VLDRPEASTCKPGNSVCDGKVITGSDDETVGALDETWSDGGTGMMGVDVNV
jgi:hypothetical protein